VLCRSEEQTACTAGKVLLPVIEEIRKTLGKASGDISLQRGWSNPGTGFQERWSMPQACPSSRGIWTMALIKCFNFWSVLKWSGSWTR